MKIATSIKCKHVFVKYALPGSPHAHYRVQTGTNEWTFNLDWKFCPVCGQAVEFPKAKTEGNTDTSCGL